MIQVSQPNNEAVGNANSEVLQYGGSKDGRPVPAPRSYDQGRHSGASILAVE